MKLSTLDINISDPDEWYLAVSAALDAAIDEDTVTWLTAGGTTVAAIVTPGVLRFYARYNALIPEHDQHSLDGPVECDRCSFLRENADWLFQVPGIRLAGPPRQDAPYVRLSSPEVNEDLVAEMRARVRDVFEETAAEFGVPVIPGLTDAEIDGFTSTIHALHGLMTGQPDQTPDVAGAPPTLEPS